MMPDGRYAIATGNFKTAVDIYDMNFVTGTNRARQNDAYYESECISSTNLSPDSTLNWSQNSEGKITVQVRTVTSPSACSSATYRTIANSGDLIRATTTADNYIQFKFIFQR